MSRVGFLVTVWLSSADVAYAEHFHAVHYVRTLRSVTDGHLYIVTAAAVAVPIASNDLCITLNWFCSLFSCACFTAYGRAQLQLDTLLQCAGPGTM